MSRGSTGGVLVHFSGYSPESAVLVPVFNDAADRLALNILTKCFPDREVVGIPCRDLVLGLGTLHCMSMQQPA